MEKTQMLIAHQKERGRFLKNKCSQELEDFVHIFVLLTTPYVIFELKKTPILIAHQKERGRFGQKGTARDQRILPIFLCCRPPLMRCLNEKKSNSYPTSEGRNRSGKKSFLSSQKKYSWRLEDFAHIFVLQTTPYVMFE